MFSLITFFSLCDNPWYNRHLFSYYDTLTLVLYAFLFYVTSYSSSNKNMAYAVISFLDDGSTSEIPTKWLQKEDNDLLCWWPVNTKNITSLIAKRAEPDIQTWSLLPVKLERYCSTLEKARKAAENDNYTSADDIQLGRGYRRKIPSKYVHSDSESEEDNAYDTSNHSKSNTAVKSQKMPQWPNSVTSKETRAFSPIVSPTPLTSAHNTEEECLSQSSIIETQQDITIARRNVQVNPNPNVQVNPNPNQKVLLIQTEAHTRILMKMVAELQLQVKNIIQRMDRITPIVQIVSSTQRIKSYLPLKSIEDIKNLETLLQEEDLIDEYKTFIQKIGGHTPRENVRNALTRIFSNDCGVKCSWKGRRENFAICKLRLIAVMKDIILESHPTVTERELNDIAAEWFRFAKQRRDRESKNSTQ